MQFEPLKPHLGGGCQYHNNEEVEMAIHEQLRMQEPCFQRSGVFSPFQDGKTRQCVERLCWNIIVIKKIK